MESKYINTREQCEKQIYNNQNVCSQCGGVLSPIDTVDNADRHTFWIGCMPCQRFDSGVKSNIYNIAKKLVVERHYRAYSHDQEPDKTKEPERHKYWQEIQIGGMSRQVNEIIYMYGKEPK